MATQDQDYKTAEAKAFREHCDKLVDCIQEADLPVLGARFFSREIISRETMEMVGNVSTSRAVRVSKLLLAVMAHLDTQPDKFETALDVFREEQVYSDCVCKIQESRDKHVLSEPLPGERKKLSTTAVQQYADHLRKVYLRSKLPVKGKWPPAPCKKIIKLATIEIQGDESSDFGSPKLLRSESVDEYLLNNRMDPIPMENLLNTRDGASTRLIVVQGVPGIGKSTFAWKFCHKWAKGKNYQQYDLVILLRMRDTKVREAKNLSDLLFFGQVTISKQVAEEILSSGGKNVLFLLEGIDELPASSLADGMPLSDLLEGSMLPDVAIIVTSRPWAVQSIMEKCGEQISSRVEILGFTKDDISRYISHAFTEEESTEFLEYLHSHPQLESIMHIPLNAAFVVQIYKQFKRSQRDMPSTLTQLYTALIEGLLLRYMKAHPDFATINSVSLENIPEPIHTQFHQLCLLAFMSFTKLTVQVTFTDSEAALYGCVDSLGLMQSSTTFSINTSTNTSHSFLHFTIQEFLSAYHLSKQSSQTQELFLEVHSKDPQFSVILHFLVSLNSKVLRILKPGATITNSELHLLYESQSPKDVCEYLGEGTVRYCSKTGVTALDLHALSYCLNYSNCTWLVNTSFRHLSSVHIHQSSGNAYNSSLKKLSVKETTVSKLELLFSLPKRLFSNLCSLEITEFNQESDSLDSVIADFLSREYLPHLKQTHVRNGSSNISSTIATLCASYRNLYYIGIAWSTVTYSDMLKLCEYMTAQSRSQELTMLFNFPKFEGDSLQLFISAIACSKVLTHLDLNYKLTTENLEFLSIALSTNRALVTLGLASCSIDGYGTEILVSGLEANQNLLGLDLRYNNINNHGAAALASLLTENTPLKVLYLSANKLISTEGATLLIDALEKNITLHTLRLSSECEPITYQSILMKNIRESNRVKFVNEPSLSEMSTIAYLFAPSDIWPYN